MNIILTDQNDIDGGQLILTDRRAEHIVKVLRAEVGDRLRVGQINGPMGYGTIEAMAKKHPRSVRLRLELTEPPPPLPPIDLVVAMARPIMMRRILSQLTALGVGRFYLVNAGRVEKSFWEASLLAEGGYREHLLQGLEQAVDTRLPEVSLHRSFPRFVNEDLPTIGQGYKRLILAHPGGSTSLSEAIGGGGGTGRVLLCIGPEGGWLEPEVAMLAAAGCLTCAIGSRILKVDTAAVALHARISQILEFGRGF